MKFSDYSIPVFKTLADTELANFSILDKNFYKDEILKFFSELKNRVTNITVLNNSSLDKLEIKVKGATAGVYFIKVKIKNKSVRLYFLNKLEKPDGDTFSFYQIAEKKELA